MRQLTQYVVIRVVLDVPDDMSDEDATDEFSSNVDYGFQMSFESPIHVKDTEFMES